MGARETLGLNLNGDVRVNETAFNGFTEKPFRLTWDIRFTRALLLVCETVNRLAMVLAVVLNNKFYVTSALLGAFVGHLVCEDDFEIKVRWVRWIMKIGLLAARNDEVKPRRSNDSMVGSSERTSMTMESLEPVETDDERDGGVPLDRY